MSTHKKSENILIKIIIWFFEKYAFDYWVNSQLDDERLKVKERYNLKDNKIDDTILDLQKRPFEEAYDAGVNDGINKVLQNPNRYL